MCTKVWILATHVHKNMLVDGKYRKKLWRITHAKPTIKTKSDSKYNCKIKKCMNSFLTAKNYTKFKNNWTIE